MTNYSKKFRRKRDKWKRINKRRVARGLDPIGSHEYTFKYRPKGAGIFSKRKTSTVETRSEQKEREWKESRKNKKGPEMERGPIHLPPGPDPDERRGPKGKRGMRIRRKYKKGGTVRDMFTQQYD
jgi:hypothetical protein